MEKLVAWRKKGDPWLEVAEVEMEMELEKEVHKSRNESSNKNKETHDSISKHPDELLHFTNHAKCME
uniref:Uncharacterized protein n=1 Tax=Salix viminalis TaxID=40686 RepID=A0A6N2LVL6_SALVM